MKLTLIPLLFSVLLPWQVQATEKYKIEVPRELKTSRLEVKTPVAGVEWTTDQARFDYVKTCTTAQFVVVVAHSAENKDSLVRNGSGNMVHDRTMRIGYPRLADFCAVIAEPKSMLSITHNDDGVEFNWRTWWATDFVKDYIVDDREHFDLLAFINAVKAESEDNEYEIEETIKFIKFARSELHKPVYLGFGNDFGGLAAKVLDKLGRDSETDAIDGFLHVNRETGEFTTYHRDGTILESKDN
jgi:hypothetical protein